MRRRLERLWYGDSVPWALKPLSGLYAAIAARRRQRTVVACLDVPVIVVGNISVGGTGKTPIVQWLVAQLQALGRHPGVVSRGYGGRLGGTPVRVTSEHTPTDVGDEPCLIAARTGVPVVIGRDRVAAARLLCATGVDVIVSDDGLQHYRLPRRMELCVVDGVRGLGNGACLPAGPLREPPGRLAEVDVILVNGGDWVPPGDAGDTPWCRFNLQPAPLRALGDGATRGTLADWAGRRVHAVAGIGHPQRFFSLLRDAGLEVVAHPYADHHVFTEADFAGMNDAPILMTEKDAVKARGRVAGDALVVPVTVTLDAGMLTTLLHQRLDPKNDST